MSCELLAAFWWGQPAWLVCLFAIGVAAETASLVRRRTLRQLVAVVDTSDAATEEGRFWRGAHLKPAGLVLAVLAGVAAAAVGAALAQFATPAANALLGLVAVAVGAAWTIGRYRELGTADRRWGRLSLPMLRCLAWLLLLMVLGRPVWEWAAVTLQRPLLVVLLDQSDSMAIVDGHGAQARPSRAETANAAFKQAQKSIERLNALYDVRLWGVGMGSDEVATWKIAPAAPMSGLTGALREAAGRRSEGGAPPRGVLLVSDGAENVNTVTELRRAVADLAAQGTALWAAGVGPLPGTTPLVELDPLVLPARLGPRDRVHATVAGRAQGCAGTTLEVSMLWDGEPGASRQVRVGRENEHIASDFDLAPPGLGLHRLTARVALPASAGNASFMVHATVDVREERVRVLWVEGAPRNEAAFVTRVLQSDPQLEVTRRFLFGAEAEGGARGANTPPAWTDYDVIVLGSVSEGLSNADLDELSRAVAERGVGLLLAGGRRLLNESDAARVALAAVSPVKLVRDEFGLSSGVRFVPTELGLSHPVLRAAGSAEESSPATQASERAPWLALSPLGGAALLGHPKAAAAVLAEDGAGRPLLVAQDVGRGRCVAAAWENTWPWALASDDGAVLQRRLWRQLTAWLANRRPQAWLLTDEPVYPLAALTRGLRRVQVRAGVSGEDLASHATTQAVVDAQLTLVHQDEQTVIPLERRGGEWTAELGAARGAASVLDAGDYVLEFRGRMSAGRTGTAPTTEPENDPDVLQARTAFTVTNQPLEQQAPTANLALLRAVAKETTGQGGEYCHIEELPALLDRLAKTDQRQQVWTRRRYAAAEQDPGWLLGALVLVLGLEWAVRKRAGLT